MYKVEIDCYEVSESYDRNSSVVAYVSTIALAKELVTVKKDFRSSREFRKTFLIFESMEDVETYSRENLKKTGLAKLTSEERQALGL